MQNSTTAPRLVGFVAGLLPETDWHVAGRLAARAAEVAVAIPTLSSPDTDSESGLPRVLTSAARATVRAHLSPWAQLDTPRPPAPQTDDQLDTVLRQLRATDGPPPPPHLSAAA